MRKIAVFMVLLLAMAIFLPLNPVQAGTSKVGEVLVSNQDPNPVAPGEIAVFDVAVYRTTPKTQSTSGKFDVNLTITSSDSLLLGTMFTFSPVTLLFKSSEQLQHSTLRITTDDSIAPGTYSFSVKVTRNDAPWDFNEATVKLVVGRDYYVIQVSQASNGEISPQGEVKVQAGEDQMFTITAYPGYSIAALIVDGVSEASSDTYTFKNVQTDHTITARFELNFGLELPPGSNLNYNVNVHVDSPPEGFLPLPGVLGGVYFEVVVIEGTISGTVIVRVQYDPDGLSVEQEQELRLFIGDDVDFNDDLTIDGKDVNIIQEAIHSGSLELDKFDLTHDRVIDSADLRIVQEYSSKGILVPTPSDGQMRLPWQDITTEVDVVNHVITGETDHFSGFGVHR